jgi:hypothetical protein
MSYFNPCPLCGREAEYDDLTPGLKVKCQACGHFAITGSMEAVLGGVDERLKEKIGFWTRDQNELGDAPCAARSPIPAESQQVK